MEHTDTDYVCECTNVMCRDSSGWWHWGCGSCLSVESPHSLIHPGKKISQTMNMFFLKFTVRLKLFRFNSVKDVRSTQQECWSDSGLNIGTRLSPHSCFYLKPRLEPFGLYLFICFLRQDELLAELDELEQEELDKNLLEIGGPENAPLPNVPSTSLPSRPGRENSSVLTWSQHLSLFF